jgi:DNA-binding XRE family transcriptional regulator
MEALKSDLALNIKKIRKAQGVAQERLALDAEVDRTVVSKIERCVGNPSLDTLLKQKTLVMGVCTIDTDALAVTATIIDTDSCIEDAWSMQARACKSTGTYNSPQLLATAFGASFVLLAFSSHQVSFYTTESVR